MKEVKRTRSDLSDQEVLDMLAEIFGLRPDLAIKSSEEEL